MPRKLPGLLAALLLVATGPILAAEPAEPAEPTQEAPLVVESDEMVIRDAEQQAVYSGAVKATKGEMVLRADRLVVNYTDAGLQRAHAYGQPVTMDRGDRHGEAREAIYDANDRSLLLMGAARLEDGPNVLEGARIRYYLDQRRTEVFSDDPEGAEDGDGRARAVFQPGSAPGEEDDGDAATESAPADE
ncbi:MAG TPA: lipopolysaccharide transport periplasmic protein LptA [Gammaproteobacteria bacterium]|nr:lipopolysaccharide transport periplasmic protein LptA [Gammaproteobacteria bacterium]